MVLSDDQRAALDACLSALKTDPVVVLVGPAGSGKTTLMRELLARLPAAHIALACPTGKAARRLSALTGRHAMTIHRLMYDPPEESEDDEDDLVFSGKKKRLPANSLLVVDEASMLGSKLAADLLEWLPGSCRALFVGDREQLEPVKDTWGVPLDQPTAALTQVHRQALENPIIALATAIRQGDGDEWMRTWRGGDDRVSLERGMGRAVEWYLDRRDRDVAAICYTHRTREQFNARVRAELGRQRAIEPGDRLLIRVNSPQLDVMNGDVIRVADVGAGPLPGTVEIECDDARRFAVNLALLNGEVGAFWRWKRDDLLPWQTDHPWIHAWHGEALTVHSSQGSQWADVAFLWDSSFTTMRSHSPDAARRLLYTAVTRAADRLAIFAGGGL